MFLGFVRVREKGSETCMGDMIHFLDIEEIISTQVSYLIDSKFTLTLDETYPNIHDKEESLRNKKRKYEEYPFFPDVQETQKSPPRKLRKLDGAREHDLIIDDSSDEDFLPNGNGVICIDSDKPYTRKRKAPRKNSNKKGSISKFFLN